MLKGRKQIDGTFVDKNGRVVSTISARYLQKLIERNAAMEEALRDIQRECRAGVNSQPFERLSILVRIDEAARSSLSVSGE